MKKLIVILAVLIVATPVFAYDGAGWDGTGEQSTYAGAKTFSSTVTFGGGTWSTYGGFTKTTSGGLLISAANNGFQPTTVTTANGLGMELLNADDATYKSFKAKEFLATQGYRVQMVADAAMPFGSVVMADASAQGRFDIATGSGTLAIGILSGPGDSVQGTATSVTVEGMAYVIPLEDTAITFNTYAEMSATAGKVASNASLPAAGKRIGTFLTSAAVSATISGSGGVNTTTEVITCGVDVAALGWAVGDPVVYYNSGGTTLGGLADGGVYFIRSVSTTDVTLAATPGGALLNLSDDGDDNTQYIVKLPLVMIHWN